MNVKNLRPNILVLAKANLILQPGQVVDVEDSPEIQRAIQRGALAVMDTKAPESVADEPVDVDLSKLGWSDAADAVQTITDLDQLERLAKRESRRTVVDAINKRRRELRDVDR